MKNFYRLFAFLIALILLLSGCASVDEKVTVPTGTGDPQSSETGAPDTDIAETASGEGVTAEAPETTGEDNTPPEATQTQAKPTETQPKPAETQTKPAETQPKPTQTQAKPTQTQAKPTQTQAKPTQTQAKPTQTQNNSNPLPGPVGGYEPGPDDYVPPANLNPDFSALFPGWTSWPTCTVDVEGIFYDEEAKKVLQMVNDFRVANGVEPLVWGSEAMENATKTRAAELSISYSHTRPDGSKWWTCGQTPEGTLMSGENIAYGYPTAELVFQAWINSEGHRANILTPGYKRMCVAFMKTQNGWFWAQEFAY